MLKLVFAVIAIVVAAGAHAEDGAARMSRDELMSFLPGTKVIHKTEAGSVRRWTHGPDGSFVVSSDNKKYGNSLGTQTASARGIWKVSDEGKYCVDIDWKRLTEKWCAYVLKSPDGMYYLNTADASHLIEFGK